MTVYVIAGPTASGKTKLGVELAKRTNGEVVSCDSMQIYRDIPICSAQPTEDEKQGIPHHLMGFLDFSERFTVADYREKALDAIRDIFSRGKQPIVVGGTGLYFHWLMYEPDFGAESNGEVRQALARLSNDELYARLTAVDPDTAISKNDTKRLIRALEIYELSGSVSQKMQKRRNTEFDFRLYCVAPEREELYSRINARVDIMLENGMREEIYSLWKKGINESHQCYKAIGCRQLIDLFEGRCTEQEAIEKIKQESRRYAKRQLTWMRGEKDAVWTDAESFFK